MFRNCVLLFTIICAQYVRNTEIFERHEKHSDDYGPYELVYNHYEVCKGPKLKDTGILQFNLEKNSKNEYISLMNLTMHEQCIVGETRILVFAIKNGRRNVLFNYRLTKSCEHFAFAVPLKLYLQADSKNKCTIKKGSYIFNINFTEYAKIFFGKAFFYGNLIFKVTLLSSKGNVLCLILDANFNKIA